MRKWAPFTSALAVTSNTIVSCIKCTLWLFLFLTSHSLNAKCHFHCFNLVKQSVGQQKLSWKEVSKEEMNMFICFCYSSLVMNTDRKLFFQKAPRHMLYLHINDRRWFISTKETMGYIWQCNSMLLLAVYSKSVAITQPQEVRQLNRMVRRLIDWFIDFIVLHKQLGYDCEYTSSAGISYSGQKHS